MSGIRLYVFIQDRTGHNDLVDTGRPKGLREPYA